MGDNNKEFGRAYVDANGELRDFFPPTRAIWYDDQDLAVAFYVAFLCDDGMHYAIYFERTGDGRRHAYVMPYDAQFVASLGEDYYQQAEWIYEARFDGEFPYDRMLVRNLNEENLAKLMFVLLAGSYKLRARCEHVYDVTDVDHLESLLGHFGLPLELNERIIKTGRRTYTIYSERGRKLGRANSREAAKRRLKQIHAFKAMNESLSYTPQTIEDVAKAGGVDISGIDMEEIMLGMSVEMEHGSAAGDANVTDDSLLDTLKIAVAHLREFDKYYTEVLLPAEDLAEIDESMHVLPFGDSVPLFEDFSDYDYKMSDWHVGNMNGSPYMADGRELVDFDFERLENQPDNDDNEVLSAFCDAARGIVDDCGAPTKRGGKLYVGFDGPEIAVGPYAGQRMTFTLVLDDKSGIGALINDVAGESVMIKSVADFTDALRKMISELS